MGFFLVVVFFFSKKSRGSPNAAFYVSGDPLPTYFFQLQSQCKFMHKEIFFRHFCASRNPHFLVVILLSIFLFSPMLFVGWLLFGFLLYLSKVLGGFCVHDCEFSSFCFMSSLSGLKLINSLIYLLCCLFFLIEFVCLVYFCFV